MAQESFDDEKLQNLARYTLHTCRDLENTEKVRDILDKESLSNSERNFLVGFVQSGQKAKPKSMREMKNEIMTMVGGEISNSYSNTMTAAEVKVIYEWFMENYKGETANG